MIKKGLILLFIVAIVVTVFKSGVLSNTPMFYISDKIKTTFLDSKESIKSSIARHVSQAETIRDLTGENERLRQETLVLSGFANEIVELGKFKGYEKGYLPKLRVVRVTAYAELPYFQKLWVDYDDYNGSKIYGLLYNNKTAGIIAGGEKGSALALLNGDPKCSYAVYVGKKKAPGIVVGRNDREMVVKYIPSWIQIEAGDEVMTSGLDGIFFAGIKVGVVKEVTIVHAYKEAVIETYFNTLNPSYLYVIEETK
jgi:rod shape-determining protein MreC